MQRLVRKVHPPTTFNVRSCKSFSQCTSRRYSSASMKPNFSIVVVDCETTNRSPSTGRIIEIAGVKITDGVHIGSYSSLINTPTRLQKDTIAITGITENMLSKAPSPGFVLHQFVEFIGDSVLVAHNAAFDIRYILNELKRNKVPVAPCLMSLDEEEVTSSEFTVKRLSIVTDEDLQEDGDESDSIQIKEEIVESESLNVHKQNALEVGHLCTLKLARRLFPDAPSYKLTELCEHLKLPVYKGHRALNDVQMTAALWRYIYRDVSNRLGFGAPLQFFYQLSNIASKDVDTVVENYRVLNEQR